MAIEQRGSEFCVTSEDGSREFGCFPTRERAEQRLREVEFFGRGDGMERAVRFDIGSLGRAETTPQGFLRVPGNVTRVGVLSYARADGSTFRELRHPDEVFRGDSLRSLGFAPVTDRHPAELVSPRNVRDLQVGIVTNARQDTRFVRSDLIVQDQRMIEKVQRGDARELSAGYTCRIDATPGEFQGERYDGIQRGIEYNHVALGPRDWGRAGPQVALHVDGMDDALRSALGVERFDAELATLLALHPEAVLPLSQNDAGRQPGKEPPVDTKTIRIDGIDYKVDASAAPHIEGYISKLASALGVETKRADTAEGKLGATTAELGATKTKLDAATKPETIQTAVRSRVALEASARKVLGPEAKLDGKLDREIKVEVLKSKDEKFDAKDRSDAYIDGRFDIIVETAPARRDARDQTRQAVAGAGGGSPVPPDATAAVIKIDSAAAAKKAADKKAREMGRGPLPSQRRRDAR